MDARIDSIFHGLEIQVNPIIDPSKPVENKKFDYIK